MLLNLFPPNREMRLGWGFAESHFAQENFSVLRECVSLGTPFQQQ